MATSGCRVPRVVGDDAHGPADEAPAVAAAVPLLAACVAIPPPAQPPRDPPWQHERTGHAEQIARHQQGQHHQPAIMEPDAHRGQVLRRQLRPDQAVEDDQRGRQEEGHLQGRPRMAPFQKAPQDGPTQQVERVNRPATGHGR